MIRVLLVLALAARVGRADVPVAMPDLEPAHELAASATFASGNLVQASALVIEVRGRAHAGPIEAFASVPMLAIHVVGDERSGLSDKAMGSAQLGARGRGSIELAGGTRLAGALAAWAWLPTAGGLDHSATNPVAGNAASPESIDALVGLRDPYAWADRFALGVAIDLRAGDRRGFVQVQLGAALVVDESLAGNRMLLDDIFVAVGIGTRRGAREFAAEYRVVREPTLAAPEPEHQHGVAVAYGRWYGAALWRVRGGLASVDFRRLPERSFEGGRSGPMLGATVGLDVATRF